MSSKPAPKLGDPLDSDDLAAIGDRPGRWFRFNELFVQVRYSRHYRGWHATTYYRFPKEHWRTLEIVFDRNILGAWPTPEKAVEAARDCLAMAGGKAQCTWRDVLSVRKELREQAAARAAGEGR